MENPQKRTTKVKNKSGSSVGGQQYAAHANKHDGTEHLRVWYTNVDSLRGKLPELESRINLQMSPDIIVITETWAKHGRNPGTEAEYQIRGFNLHCTQLDTGRGICVYTKCTLKTDIVETTSSYKEQLCLSIPLHKGDRLILCSVYRSPNSDDANNDMMYELLEEINQIRASHKLILGDFNLPNINWRNNSAADRKSEKFLDTIQRFYWTQHTLEPTRTRGTNTPSVLDLIMTEDENNIDNLVYESPLGKSDHCLINFNYNCYSLHNSTSYLKYFFDKGDYISFNRVFQADWDSAEESGEMDGVGPEELWKIFLRIYYKNLEEHVPSKVISNGGKKWTIPLDTKLREKIREKHRAWRKFMRNKNDENQRAYIKCRNFIRNQTRKIRNHYERTLPWKPKLTQRNSGVMLKVRQR